MKVGSLPSFLKKNKVIDVLAAGNLLASSSKGAKYSCHLVRKLIGHSVTSCLIFRTLVRDAHRNIGCPLVRKLMGHHLLRFFGQTMALTTLEISEEVKIGGERWSRK